MSVRENLALYGLPGQEHHSRTLAEELGAKKHPNETNAYMLDAFPFHAPRLSDDYISILSFNNLPLPDSLREALVDRPE